MAENLALYGARRGVRLLPTSSTDRRDDFALSKTFQRGRVSVRPAAIWRMTGNIMLNLGRPPPVRGWIQQHPSKCPRPLASGTIPLWQSICAVLLRLGAAILLQAASPCRAAEGSTDSTWSQGLTLGVNGPIPVIVVDQFGYPTKAAKIAVIRGNDTATAAKADSAAMGYLHYIHGVNPLGLVYLTNMKSAGAEHFATTMFHTWFAHGTPWSEVSGAMPGPHPDISWAGLVQSIQRTSAAPPLLECRRAGSDH